MRHLGIPLLGNPLAPSGQPAFGASIEARTGVTTGISAGDRARDDPGRGRRRDAARAISRCPGTCSRSRSQRGGVLAYRRHPEGAVDLMRLAGMRPAAVLCTVLCEDGSVATRADIERLAAAHDLRMTTLAALGAHRLRSELLVERAVESEFTTASGGTLPGDRLSERRRPSRAHGAGERDAPPDRRAARTRPLAVSHR